jgi:alpha-2-macroglobulin
MGRFFIAAIILLFSFDNYAQSGISDYTWLHIDTSIARKRNLADIDSLVSSLRQKAWAEHRYSDIARCYYNQIRIADQRTEDSFYFRNSAIIDSLLMTKNLHPELQLAMHVLKAKRLSVFTTMYKKFNEARYERKDIPFNYAAYSNHRLDSIAQHHFQLAKEMSISMPVKDSREFNWLSTDLLLFLFKPRLYDIISAEQISFYHSQLRGQNMTLIKKLPYYLSLSPDAFISSLDSIAQLQDE